MRKIKWFKSLKLQIVVAYLLASLLTILLIGLLVYLGIGSAVLNDKLSQSEMAVEQSGIIVKNYMDKVSDLAGIIGSNPATQRYFSAVAIRTEDEEDILAIIDAMQEAEPYLLSVILVGEDGRLVTNEEELKMSMSSDMMNESWYVAALEKNGMPSLTSARMQNFNMDKDHWVISLSQEMKSPQGDRLGVLVMDFKYSVIEDYLQVVDLGKEGYPYILNSKDEVVYHHDPTYFMEGAAKEALVAMSHMDVGYDRSMNLLIHKYPVEGTDWTLYGVASLDNLEVIRRQLVETIIFVGGLGILAMFLVGLYLASQVIRPLKRLEEAMASIEGDLSQSVLVLEGTREITSLAEHYNDMLKRIRDLMADVSIKEQAIRAYELNVLHSQINPHFLYNTLDTIVWMAEFGDSDKVIHITKALARFFRLSLSGGSEMTTIQNEVDHVRQYLFIQKERYGDQLTYTIYLEEGLESIEIPKIILQPLVENAIYHGIRHLERPGMIRVEVRRQESDIIMSIIDNGDGFDPEVMVKAVDRGGVKLGGVGLRNVDQRLRLLYGDSYGVKVMSTIGQGTRVDLGLPYRTSR